MPRKIRVLVGKPGLDGHDRGAKVVAAALRDAGMEVIYSGLHQTSEQIVEAAIQEDVDVVALSILSGAHMTLFPEVHDLMRERGIDDKLLTGGGIIPPEDMATLSRRGVGRLFGPGSSTQDIVVYVRDWFASKHGAGELTPLPAPPRAATPARVPTTRRTVSAPEARPAATTRAKPARRAAKTASRPTPRVKRADATRTAAKPAAAKRTGTRRVVAKRASAKARPRARSKASGRRR
jgi:methylmalonyl-CoA mutase C-terminal domain/subunit